MLGIFIRLWKPFAPRYEKLQQGRVSRVETALCHDVPGELLGRHRPRRVPQCIERRPRQIATQCPVRRARDLLADALDIVARIENPDRGVDMIEIDDQLPQRSAGVRNLTGDFGTLLDQPKEGVRPLNGHAALLFQ
jgi:hypothetical protein